MPRSEIIRLLIVDDHKVVRNGLRVFVSLYDDVEIVGEAKNGQEAVELCARLDPDVILMDLVMPVMDGPTAIGLIRDQHPRAGVVALTSYDDEALVLAAIDAGALGFLYKDADEEELIGAIRAASQGSGMLAPEAIRALSRRVSGTTEDPDIESLTAREHEILQLMGQGMTNPRIADELVISSSTVSFHVGNILAKLNAGTRTEAVAKAIRLGLIVT